MGKGDKKTRRGKIIAGSYGVRRKKNRKGKNKAAHKPAVVSPEIEAALVVQPEITPPAVKEIEVVPDAEVAEKVKVSDAKVKKPAKKKPAAKPKAKKEDKPMEAEKTD